MPWGIDRVFKYIGFYALGCFLHGRNAVERLQDKPKYVIAILLSILLMMSIAAVCFGLINDAIWFVTGTMGTAIWTMVAVLIETNHILQYYGRISLVVLCVHGPVYRVIVKLLCIPLQMSTDAVRESFILAIIVGAVTLILCSVIYEGLLRSVPCILGKYYPTGNRE